MAGTLTAHQAPGDLTEVGVNRVEEALFRIRVGGAFRDLFEEEIDFLVG